MNIFSVHRQVLYQHWGHNSRQRSVQRGWGRGSGAPHDKGKGVALEGSAAGALVKYQLYCLNHVIITYGHRMATEEKKKSPDACNDMFIFKGIRPKNRNEKQKWEAEKEIGAETHISGLLCSKSGPILCRVPKPPGNCPLFPRPAVMGSHFRLLITPSATPCFLNSWPRAQVTLVLAAVESRALLTGS